MAALLARNASMGAAARTPDSSWSGLASRAVKEEEEQREVPAPLVVDLVSSERPIKQEEKVVAASSAAGGLSAEERPEAKRERPDDALPDDVSAERAIKRKREAEKLLALLPPYALQVAGGRGSSEPKEKYHDAAVRRIADGIGGKGAAASVEARLFLQDLAAENGAEFAHFPITTAEASSLLDSLADKGKTTAVARVAPAMQTLANMGLVQDLNLAMLATRGTTKEAGEKQRATPTPLMVLRHAEAARKAAGHPGGMGDYDAFLENEVVLMKIRESNVQMMASMRGGAFADSHVDFFHSPGTYAEAEREYAAMRLVNHEDKKKRLNVKIQVPLIDVSTGSQVEWAAQFAAERIGTRVMVSNWLSEDRRQHSCLAGKSITRNMEGSVTFCPEKRALESLRDVLHIGTGVKEAALKENKHSGTHLWRHLGGEVTGALQWPPNEADVVGDWATPTGAESSTAPKKAKTKAGTREKHYKPIASAAEQLDIRARYLNAIAAGLKAFGHDKLSHSTGWGDIFPSKPPPSLEAFYGPRLKSLDEPFGS